MIRAATGLIASMVAVLVSWPALSASVPDPLPKPARISMHIESVHGVETRDPYRWMEDTTSAEFNEWASAQQRYAEATLKEVGPQARLRDAIAASLQGLPTLGAVNPTVGRVLLTRWLESGQALHALDDGTGEERSVLTKAMLEAAKRGTRIRRVTPSWDGRYAAITTTGSGDKAPQISVLDLQSGDLLPDHVTDMLPTTSGSRYKVAWLPDSSGFVYPRLSPTALTGPSGEMYSRGRQFLHRIGKPVSDDIAVFGHGVNPAISTDIDDLPSAVLMSPDSKWVVARLARVKRDKVELWAAPLDAVLAGSAAWKRISEDGHGAPALGGTRLYAMTSEGADRRRIVALNLDDATPAWVTVVPQREGVIRDFVLAGDDTLYFTELREARDWLYRARADDGVVISIEVPLVGSARLAPPLGRRDGIWLEAANWIDPGGWYRVVPGSNTATRAPLPPGGATLPTDDLVVEQLMLPATDGVRIPVSVVRPRGRALDGTLPLLLEAYGSYGTIQAPEFNPYISLWVREGAAYAYAHVRGGGELGDAWHRAALRETKSVTTTDVLAVAQGLVARGYTRPEKTIFLGMSNGAQPAGLALAMRPQQFGVVVYNVGQPDDLRGAIIDPTSRRNLGELGDTDTKVGVELLIRNSPYYQLPEKVALPTVVVKSAPDDYNYGSAATTAKYVALLQSANTSDNPIIWLHQPGGHSWLFDEDPARDAILMTWLLKRTGRE